jgi:hypothetical protein
LHQSAVGKSGTNGENQRFRQAQKQAHLFCSRPACEPKSSLSSTEAFFAEPKAIKRDEIAARQLEARREHRRPRDSKLRLSGIKETVRADNFMEGRTDGRRV